MLPKSKGSRTRPRRKDRAFKPQLELLEERVVPDVRSFSGVGNNIANPHFGEAGRDLLRLSPVAYVNGFSTPSLTYGAPNFVAGPRLVSNFVSNQATVLFGPTDINTVNGNSLSGFGYTWGQFLDHDMDLTPDQTGQPVPPPPNTNRDGNNGFPIPTDPSHPDDPIRLNPEDTLAFSRSIFPNSGPGSPGPDGIGGTADDIVRQQPNVVSSFLDLSQVYGSSDFIARALRNVVNNGPDGLFGTPDDVVGRYLKTSPGADGVIRGSANDDLLPFNNLTYFSQAQLDALHMANDVGMVANSELFAAGDVRANEVIELTSLHTLFVRNHNRIANLVAPQFSSIPDPVARDEAIFQEARRLNIAGYQNIIYAGYLPALLGPTALPAYTGYQSSVNPTVSTEFSTIAFRFGHSLLNNNVPRHNNDGSSVGDVALAVSFFNPRLLTPGQPNSTDIDAILKGDADVNSQANDVLAVSAIRNLLFGAGGQGEDLIARDIWRADDHGIGTLNQVLTALGLPAITNTGSPNFGFEQITSDVTAQHNLFTAFADPAVRPTFLANGKFAGDINPFIAGLAEDHVLGSDLGPQFHRILVDQFRRLRDGDRFFFLNDSFSPEDLAIIGGSDTLAEVIRANTSITNLQDDVFVFAPVFQVSVSGTVWDDHDRDGFRDRNETVVVGERVRLTNLATGARVHVFTDANGRYRFDQANGLGLGNWEVHLLVPNGQATTPHTVNVSITRNGLNLQVNFGFNDEGDGHPLMAAGGPATDSPSADFLTDEQLQPIVQEALARWQAAGADASLLHRAAVRITDLGGAYLGLESGTTVWIDDNAAGWGWFIDPTPAGDSEFTTPGDQGEQGRMDLLTTLMHELGHVLGLADLYDPADSGQLMYGFLGNGERRTPTGDGVAIDLSVAFSREALPAADVPTLSNPGSPDGPAAGASVDIARLVAEVLEGTSGRRALFAFGDQDQQDPSPSGLLPLPATVAEAAPAVVADDKRQRARTTAVLDPLFADPGSDLLKVEPLTDPAPALRPPQ